MPAVLIVLILMSSLCFLAICFNLDNKDTI